MNEKSIEIHPFEAFIPKDAKYLLLGSFPCKNIEGNYGQWFYCGSGKNLLWTLLEKVYQKPLKNKIEKQLLFESLGIAITDVFAEIERKKDSCLDVDIIPKKYKDAEIAKILAENNIEKIFCTSRFVEHIFNTRFPNHQATYIPSPSPRNAKMTREGKIIEYKRQLPIYDGK